MVECFSCQFGERCDIGVDIGILHLQLVKFGCSVVGFVRIGPRLDKGNFEVVVNSHVWIGGRRVGQDPDLCVSFPLVDFGTVHICQGVGDFLSWVRHYWMCGVDELIKAEFM